MIFNGSFFLFFLRGRELVADRSAARDGVHARHEASGGESAGGENSGDQRLGPEDLTWT